ncbi:MAG: type VII secretion protein EssC [Bacilli bacterium]
MRVSLLKDGIIKDLILPNKVSGNYWLTAYDNDGNETNLINIEAQEGVWRLISNDDVFCIVNEHKVAGIIMQEYNFYAIKDIQDNKYMIVYCAPVNDTSFSFYKIKSLTQGITIGSDDSCDVVYKTDFVAFKHARISLSSLEKEGNDRYKFIIKSQDAKYGIRENKWGVYVNNNKINGKCYLQNGDNIFIMGLRILIFLLDGTYVIAINSPGNMAYVSNLEAVHIEPVDLPYEQDENEIEMNLYSPKDYFHKKPRFVNVIETFELKVDAPPGKEKTEQESLVIAIGSMLTMSLTSLVMGYSAVTSAVSGNQSWIAIMPSMVICFAMFASIFLWPIIMRKYDKKKKINNEKERQEKYSKYIDDKRKAIQDEVQRQQSILISAFPTTLECYNTVLSTKSRLWERRKEDDDFLKINLGIGNQDMKIDIKYPEEHFSMVEDNLKDAVNKLGTEPKKLINVPIALSLKEYNVLALVGNRIDNSNYIKQLILQLTSLHSYDDLKLVVFTNSRNSSDWDFLKICPHLFSNDRKMRFFGTDNEEYKEICYFLEREYLNRTGKIDDADNYNDTKADSSYTSHYVIVTDSYKTIRNFEFIKKVLKSNDSKGFSFIVLNDKVSTLPSECQTFINIDGNKGVLFKSSNDKDNIDFVFDNNDYDYYECMKILANIPIEISTNKMEQLPDKVGFLQMYGVGKIEQLNVLNRWKKNNPELSLNAPVGYGEGGEKISLDLHEKYHGPHGLIAGMTGSGKSEFIITYVLSMAINYHPYEVQFILIDYKGGGLAGAFENMTTRVKLPHLIGTITNLDTNEIKRSLASIESELKRRQRAFNIAREESGESTIDIYKYQRMYRDGIIKEPVSHLFIICDEFAELKNQQSEFMDQLISIARIGRSLGVHLILATQKPSGVVDPQIWSNTRFRVCLRVQEKSDSAEVIKCPDAALLKKTGRFYFQVGFNEIFELGQAAWAGGKYIPSDKIRKELDSSINFINNIGYSVKVIDNKKKNDSNNPNVQGEELTNLVKYLFDTANAENIYCNPLWLPKLPGEILIDNLITKYGYQKQPFIINPIVGEYDVPSMQQQNLLTLPITEVGNTLIYGMTGSGKENLISTIIYSSMLYHTAFEVNYYIIDFGSETLKVFKNSPIVGDILISDDEEKIENLFKNIATLIEERKDLFADYNGDYLTYLRNSNDVIPAVIVIINNYESFCDTYSELEDKLIVLSRECSKYGIYFILTVTTPNGVRFKLKQNFSKQFVLGQSSEDDYITILGNVSSVYPSKMFGRGIFKTEETYEFQTASVAPKNVIGEVIKKKCTELSSVATAFARSVPVLPNIVSFEDIKEDFGQTNELIMGINKHTLYPVKYDYRRNRINLITSSDSTSFFSLIRPIILELLYLKDSVIFINADDYDFDQNCIKYIDYYNNNFDEIFEKIKTCVIDNYNLFVNNGYNKAVFDNMKNLTIVINGVDTFRSRLNPENIKEFSSVFEKIKYLDFITFIFLDSVDSVKKYELDTWFKSNANTKYGIWVGNGINEQFTLKITERTKDVREDIGDEFGFVVKKGKLELTKFISVFDIDEE